MSPHITSQEEQDEYYEKGKLICKIYNLFDLENTMEQIMARGDEEEIAQAQARAPEYESVGAVQWAAILQSGMLPQWEFHHPLFDAIRAGRDIEFVGMPDAAIYKFARYPSPRESVRCPSSWLHACPLLPTAFSNHISTYSGS